MARSTGWTFFWALLLGSIAASIFLLYGPYLEREINRRVAGALEKKDNAYCLSSEKVTV